MELRKLEESKIKKLNKLLKDGAITEFQFRIASNFVREYYRSKSCKLKESKTNQLRKLLNAGNITEDQFNTADKFFKDHSDFEKEIDWNKGLKITWEELEKVIKKERNTKSQANKKIRKGLEGFKEGKDYIILAEGKYYESPWVAYQPFTWEASRMIASHYVEPSENEYDEIKDAEWCTAYQKNRDYWNAHNEIEAFIYICGETIPTKKVAISISKEDEDANGSEFRYYLNEFNFNIWDFENDNYSIEEEELSEVVPNLYNLINKAYSNWKNKKIEKILSEFRLNPQTNRYDYDRDLNSYTLKYFVAKNKDGFNINFGEIKGDFDCSSLELTSLKGAPKEVGGRFKCSNNYITSLEGSPRTVGRHFDCSDNRLTSLKGAPKEVGGGFYCNSNRLTSLRGVPQIIGEGINCSDNYLISLEGSPQTVGAFDCLRNSLTSLKGAPQTVNGWFDCSENHLTSLEGSPQTVEGNFDCSHNYLTSLKGAPQTVIEDFNCESNPNLHSLKGIGEVLGRIYKDF